MPGMAGEDAGRTYTRAVDIDGPAGRLEAVLMTPANAPAAAAVLCHAHPLHGGVMHFKLLFRVAKVLQARGHAVLRFNFRGVGRSEGAHDEGRGERDDVRAALDELDRRFEGLPVLLGGFSFGAAMALRVSDVDPRPSRVLAMGAPVDYLRPLKRDVPRLFVQGARDRFGPEAAIRAYVDRDVPGEAELVVVPDADHFFTGRIDAVERAVEAWL